MICVKKRTVNEWLGIAAMVDYEGRRLFKRSEIERPEGPSEAEEMTKFIDVIRAAGDTEIHNLKRLIRMSAGGNDVD